MMNSTTKNKIYKVIGAVSAIALCLVIWQCAALVISNEYFLPTVPQTLIALLSLFKIKNFGLYILISLGRVLLGLILGIIFGMLFGTLCYLLPFLHSGVSILISIMKATPIAAIILILWFTFTDTSLAVIVVILMVTPIVWQNVYDAFKSIPDEMKELCTVYEFSFIKKMKLLVFPAILKYLIPAIITSVGLAWKAEIASEIMTYSNIGRSIQDFKSLKFDTASVYAWAIVIIAVSIALECIAKHLLRRIRA